MRTDHDAGPFWPGCRNSMVADNADRPRQWEYI
jgi:hypothetical protein